MTPEEIADLAHLRRARDLMDRDYAEPLDVPAMARAALMSPAHFSRKFRAAYGETPYSYLMTRRIERAKALLRQGMSVTDTCVAVGCTSLGSFSSRFTEIVGETPSQYRARDHRDLEVVPVVREHGRDATAAHPGHGLSPDVGSGRTASRSAPSRIGEARGGSVPRTVVAWQSPSPPCSSPSTTPTPRSASTATRSASRSATTSRPTASAGSPSARPGQDVDIVLFQPHGGRSQAEGDALLSLVTQGSLQAAIFRSDDLDATFEKVRASGAEVLQEPASQPWGAPRLRVPRPLGQPRPHRAGLTSAARRAKPPPERACT